MIKITGLSKQYTDQTVLHNINLNISRGEIHGLLGGSGAGKSTLLRCINGLEAYNSGSLVVDGVEVKNLQGQVLRIFRKKIGMIFQDFALLERKTALENIMLPMQCWHYSAVDAQKKAHELLELVGIAEKAHCRPCELSGGQKQRVAIARTLALDPQILLCDEATSALDPVTTYSVLNLLKSIHQELNITMVVVTHQMDVVKAICNKLSIVEQGKIVVSGDVNQIFIEAPQALTRLAGTPEFDIPPNHVAFKITLNGNQMNQPVLSELAINLQINYTLLHAQTDHCTNGTIGHFYIAVATRLQKPLASYLQANAIQFTQQPSIAQSDFLADDSEVTHVS